MSPCNHKVLLRLSFQVSGENEGGDELYPVIRCLWQTSSGFSIRLSLAFQLRWCLQWECQHETSRKSGNGQQHDRAWVKLHMTDVIQHVILDLRRTINHTRLWIKTLGKHTFQIFKQQTGQTCLGTKPADSCNQNDALSTVIILSKKQRKPLGQISQCLKWPKSNVGHSTEWSACTSQIDVRQGHRDLKRLQQLSNLWTPSK